MISVKSAVRLPRLMLILAIVAGAASCTMEGQSKSPDYGCEGSGGIAGVGVVRYEIRDPIAKSGSLPYCGARSFFDEDGFTVLAFTRKDSLRLFGASVMLTIASVDSGDPLATTGGFAFSTIEEEATDNGNWQHDVTAGQCTVTLSRWDAIGMEGTFACASPNRDASGSFAVVYANDAATESPLPTAATPGPTSTAPASSSATAGRHCGGNPPSGEVATGSVEFDVQGERGSLPFCSQFSDLDADPAFLVFQENPDSTEPEGLNLTLGPAGNRVDYYASHVPTSASDCDVTLIRDDASGIQGTFSCTATAGAITGTFVVNR